MRAALGAGLLTCPDGWHLAGDRTRCFSAFWFKDADNSWSRAMDACVSMNTTLMTFHDAEDESVVTGTLGKQNACWVGLRKHAESEWFWVDDQDFEMENLKTTKVFRGGSEEERCGTLAGNGLQDRPCRTQKIKCFVCASPWMYSDPEFTVALSRQDWRSLSYIDPETSQQFRKQDPVQIAQNMLRGSVPRDITDLAQILYQRTSIEDLQRSLDPGDRIASLMGESFNSDNMSGRIDPTVKRLMASGQLPLDHYVPIAVAKQFDKHLDALVDTVLDRDSFSLAKRELESNVVASILKDSFNEATQSLIHRLTSEAEEPSSVAAVNASALVADINESLPIDATPPSDSMGGDSIQILEGEQKVMNAQDADEGDKAYSEGQSAGLPLGNPIVDIVEKTVGDHLKSIVRDTIETIADDILASPGPDETTTTSTTTKAPAAAEKLQVFHASVYSSIIEDLIKEEKRLEDDLRLPGKLSTTTPAPPATTAKAAAVDDLDTRVLNNAEVDGDKEESANVAAVSATHVTVNDSAEKDDGEEKSPSPVSGGLASDLEVRHTSFDPDNNHDLPSISFGDAVESQLPVPGAGTIGIIEEGFKEAKKLLPVADELLKLIPHNETTAAPPAAKNWIDEGMDIAKKIQPIMEPIKEILLNSTDPTPEPAKKMDFVVSMTDIREYENGEAGAITNHWLKNKFDDMKEHEKEVRDEHKKRLNDDTSSTTSPPAPPSKDGAAAATDKQPYGLPLKISEGDGFKGMEELDGAAASAAVISLAQGLAVACGGLFVASLGGGMIWTVYLRRHRRAVDEELVIRTDQLAVVL